MLFDTNASAGFKIVAWSGIFLIKHDLDNGVMIAV